MSDVAGYHAFSIPRESWNARRTKSEGVGLQGMDEGGKRVLLIAASILARHLNRRGGHSWSWLRTSGPRVSHRSLETLGRDGTHLTGSIMIRSPSASRELRRILGRSASPLRFADHVE